MNTPACIRSSSTISDISSHLLATSQTKKVRIYRNGDVYFAGYRFLVSNERFPTFDNFLDMLSSSNLNDPCSKLVRNGINFIFSLDGEVITSIDQMEDGQSYVASSVPHFKRLDYKKLGVPYWFPGVARKIESTPVKTSVEFVPKHPKLIVVIKAGNRPRAMAKMMLTSRNATSMEQLRNWITDWLKMDKGVINMLCSIDGREMTDLSDIYSSMHAVFIVSESCELTDDDLYLTPEEMIRVNQSLHSHGRWSIPESLSGLKPIPRGDPRQAEHLVGRNFTSMPQLPFVQQSLNREQILKLGSASNRKRDFPRKPITGCRRSSKTERDIQHQPDTEANPSSTTENQPYLLQNIPSKTSQDARSLSSVLRPQILNSVNRLYSGSAGDRKRDFPQKPITGIRRSSKTQTDVQHQPDTETNPNSTIENPLQNIPSKTSRDARSLPSVLRPQILNTVNRGYSGSGFGLPIQMLVRYRMGRTCIQNDIVAVKRIYEKNSLRRLVLKIINKMPMTKAQLLAIESELAIIRRLNHPNLVQVINETDTPTEIYLVMELMKTSSNVQYCNFLNFFELEKDMFYSEVEVSFLARQLCQALKFLHSKHIVHRNVISNNIVVCQREDKTYFLKLGDFGLSTVVNSPRFRICGTPIYMAPEMISQVGYDEKIDIWAVGVLVFIILSGYQRFGKPKSSLHELLKAMRRGPVAFPMSCKHISNCAKDFLMFLLESDPQTRATASDVIEHPWLMDPNENALGINLHPIVSQRFKWLNTSDRETPVLPGNTVDPGLSLVATTALDNGQGFVPWTTFHEMLPVTGNSWPDSNL